MSSVADFLRHIVDGDAETVKAELAADPTVINKNAPHPIWGGEPQALHVAIEAGRRPIVDLLLEHGADVNGSNAPYDHWSPLMIAIHRDLPEIRDELLRRGARVGLVEALMMGDDQRVDELLARGLPDVVPNDGSLLAFARTPFAVDRLMTLGADATKQDRWGATPTDVLSGLGPRGVALVERILTRRASR